ncbi:class I SAM-dependent methyltransferase [Geobacter argillaceus]|uniref:Methyltransferase family protein n=1 Tax=Geobacter argillaceus TaxID=345631 RepID=A0A562WQE1_9BACT|nr:methyltransferase [Geobacter argillaceus]TWJ32445.1 methyltransferase family protein [Geobacter argillaceus]
MTDNVRHHYEHHVYPHYGLLASVRRCDTYALNLSALWGAFNGCLPPSEARRMLLAGCGSFSPYPTALANPEREIVALDLSRRSLQRARLHARLHGCRNIRYRAGDLLDSFIEPGPFGFIDCFGVLHHLTDPRAGLRSLAARLAPGGIVRIMVYSRGARREIEAARRALGLAGVKDVDALRRLVRRAPAESRLATVVREAADAVSPAGLADAFLHPRVCTFRVDDLVALVDDAGLTPLRFAHAGALPNPTEELARLRVLEREEALDHNFLLYLGKKGGGTTGPVEDGLLVLNPVIAAALATPRIRPLMVAPRLGCPNPTLDRAARRFLRRFREPVPIASLTGPELALAGEFVRTLFLLVLNP